MEWTEHAKTAFKAVLDRAPLAMRTIMESKTTKKAMELAEKRGARSIELDDLVIACFEIIPAFKHKSLQEDLKGAGVDISKYQQYAFVEQGSCNLCGKGED
jgi:hypothetical protein